MQRLRAAGAVLEERPIALARFAGVGIVGLLLLFSLFLRLRGINSHLWVDEGLSVGIARHPLSHIPSLMRQDGSPPLYYMLLHLWISLRGHGEVATHELSLIFSLLTIPAAYWLGNGIFGRRAGLTAALLAATVPYLTVYAQETRMYSLLALLALVTAGSFVQAFVWRRRLYLPVFVVSLVAALYTHNWALFLGLMSAIAFLVVVRGAPAEERRLLWIDGAIAFGAIALLLGGGAGLLAVRRSGGLRDRWPLSMGCLLLLGAGTMLVAWTYSKLSPAWAPRYLAVVVGPLILLFGLGLSRGGRLAAVALALTLCFWVFDPMGSSKDRKSNVASAVKAVKGHVRPGTLVLSTQPEQVPTLAYYLPSGLRYGTPLGPISDPHAFDWRDALSRFKHASLSAVLVKMVATLQPGQRVLLLVPLRLEDHPAWMKLINKASNRWMSALNHNPSLRRITYSAKGQNKAGVPVKATIWVKRGQTASA